MLCSQVFHQMEGVHVFTPHELQAQSKSSEQFVGDHMKEALEGMVGAVFGQVQIRYGVPVELRISTMSSTELIAFFQMGRRLLPLHSPFLGAGDIL